MKIKNIFLKSYVYASNAEIDIYIKKLERIKEKPKSLEERHHNDNFGISKDIN